MKVPIYALVEYSSGGKIILLIVGRHAHRGAVAMAAIAGLFGVCLLKC